MYNAESFFQTCISSIVNIYGFNYMDLKNPFCTVENLNFQEIPRVTKVQTTEKLNYFCGSEKTFDTITRMPTSMYRAASARIH